MADVCICIVIDINDTDLQIKMFAKQIIKNNCLHFFYFKNNNLRIQSLIHNTSNIWNQNKIYFFVGKSLGQSLFWWSGASEDKN